MRKKREHFSEKEAQQVGKDLLTATPKEADVGLPEQIRPETEPVNFEEEYEHYYGATGEEWEPPSIVSWHTPGRSGVPHYDDDLDVDVHAAPISYPAWRSDETYVVTKTVGDGRDFATRRGARQWAKVTYGGALEEYSLAGRIAFRFYKPGYGTRRREPKNESGSN